MGGITKRPDGKWRARWREYPGAKEQSKHFPRRIDAEDHLAQVRADLLRGSYIDPRAGQTTFRDFAEEWRQIQTHRASTSHQVESYLRNHVYPVLGDKPLGGVRRTQIQAMVKGLSESLAPATVEVVYRHTAAVFKAAAADRLIASTPCVDIPLPKREPRVVLPLEVDAVQALAGAMPSHASAMIALAAGTGMRQGECFGLTLDRVDLLRRTVTIDRQTDPEGSASLTPPKTLSSHRTVPLPDVVVLALAAHIKRHPVGDDGRIFRPARGTHWRRNRFREVLRRARADVGGLVAAGHLPLTATVPESMTFHDLRHFYASLLIRHGESVKVVQARLGHASASETLDTYSHLWPDSEDTTRAAVDSVLGSVADYSRTSEGQW